MFDSVLNILLQLASLQLEVVTRFVNSGNLTFYIDWFLKNRTSIVTQVCSKSVLFTNNINDIFDKNKNLT